MASLSSPIIKCIEQDEHHGRFVAEELEPGMGITLGNALRRTLLRYLPGTAITSVYIDGVKHEFAAIPNVKEDVLDFLLNIKAIRLKPLTSVTSGKLILEKSGKGLVYASDINVGADYEIVNPDQYLATIDSKEGKLYVEMTVESDMGFRAGEGESEQVGAIPVDAIFSPIRNVNYNIEPMHSGHENSKERLILDIWTDGTVEPQAALSRGTAILIDQFKPFVDFGRPASEAADEAANNGSSISDELFNTRIDGLDLSVRSVNCLQRGGIVTIGDLISKSERDLMGLRNFGAKSRSEVEEKLRALGIPFPYNG